MNISKPDGGPAFPMFGKEARFSEHKGAWVDELVVQGGMSLRDYFAAKALSGIFASGSHCAVAAAITGECDREGIATTPTDIGHFSEERIAAMAYAMADAMLAERSK